MADTKPITKLGSSSLAERAAQQFAQVPRVGKGGEYIPPGFLNEGSRGPNWLDQVQKQQASGRPEQIGRRNLYGPNYYVKHADAHAMGVHGESPHIHAVNPKGQERIFSYPSPAGTGGASLPWKAAAKALPLVGVGLSVAAVANAVSDTDTSLTDRLQSPSERARVAYQETGGLLGGAAAGAALGSLGCPVIGTLAGAAVGAVAGSSLGSSAYNAVVAAKNALSSSGGYSKSGGVELKAANSHHVPGSSFRFVEHEGPDPVSFDEFDGMPCLSFRGVRYVLHQDLCVPLTDAELAVLWCCALLFDDPVLVSLDPTTGDPGSLTKRFEPSWLSRTEVGRTMMEADVQLKRYTVGLDSLPKGAVSPLIGFAENHTLEGDESFVSFFCPRGRTWFPEPKKMSDGGPVVVYASDGMTLKCNYQGGAGDASVLEQLGRAHESFNAVVSDLCEMHGSFAKIRAYMAVLNAAWVLRITSGGAIDEGLLQYIADHLVPVSGEGEAGQIPTSEVRSANGRALGLGGVQLCGSLSVGSPTIDRPWRMARKEAGDLACDYCGWAIDLGMTRHETAYGTKACPDCSEALAFKPFQLQILDRVVCQGSPEHGRVLTVIKDVIKAEWDGKKAVLPSKPLPLDITALGKILIGRVTNFPAQLGARVADEGRTLQLIIMFGFQPSQ